MALAHLVALGAAGADEAPPALAPFQMVRSLQIVQDRIADGDHAALPMQTKMIELIDQRILDAAPEEFADRRNFDALLVYGMSGGNPQTVEAVAARLDLDQHDASLAAGLIAYFRSNTGRAQSLLAPLDPEKEGREVAAFLALIKGTLRAIEQPTDGLALMDLARLYAPGTLVEESALRRSIAIAVKIGDSERFIRASEQYGRRFLRSPYASHFADGFINGVVAFHEKIVLAEVEEIVSAMNAEQQLAVYLRIARKAAILGHAELAEFASSRAGRVDGEQGVTGDDPRAAFYNALASVATGSIEEVADRLAAIDRAALSKRDQRLLVAAQEIVKGVLAAPLGPVLEADAQATSDDSMPAETPPAAADEIAATPVPVAAAAGPELRPEAAAPAVPASVGGAMAGSTDAAAANGALAAVKAAAADAATAGAGAAKSGEEVPPEPAADEIVSSTRKTLADIDRLLEETK
jgi:chemotaxis protein MotC